MNYLITQEIFIKIFQNPIYRQKLDKIILNFFGLDTCKPENSNFSQEDILLEFLLFIDKKYVLKIIVKDTKKLFQTSKKFYINISYTNKQRYHQLIMPCYWEFYCLYSLKIINKSKPFSLICALFACQTTDEIKFVLKQTKIFNKAEIRDIINIIEINK